MSSLQYEVENEREFFREEEEEVVFKFSLPFLELYQH